MKAFLAAVGVLLLLAGGVAFGYLAGRDIERAHTPSPIIITIVSVSPSPTITRVLVGEEPSTSSGCLQALADLRSVARAFSDHWSTWIDGLERGRESYDETGLTAIGDFTEDRSNLDAIPRLPELEDETELLDQALDEAIAAAGAAAIRFEGEDDYSIVLDSYSTAERGWAAATRARC